MTEAGQDRDRLKHALKILDVDTMDEIYERYADKIDPEATLGKAIAILDILEQGEDNV